MRLLHLIVALIILSGPTAAQDKDSEIIAKTIREEIRFDGRLEETDWQDAHSIDQFTQREPSVGQPATEQTRIAVVYDKRNLWIGVWCYQQDMSAVVAKSLQRDFDEDAEDNIRIVISPFNDRRNGYLFIVNPLGARRDETVSGNEDKNPNWNGVWDARTSRDEKGWYAEIKIPFNTFKFTNSVHQVWAFNVERIIQAKNEEVRWQGWSRDHNLANLGVAGHLSGINDIQYSERFELKPYLLGGYQMDENQKIAPSGKTGADLNWNLTSNLKLNLTVNTDFAQVEADRVQVNLTRFNLYYPEKREFFLEGDQYFMFNLGTTSRVFYTRRIGIENFESVNVLGGARLFGKEGAHNIGFLSLQTAPAEGVPSTNNTVFRYKHDLGKQSYIGGILTSKANKDKQNLVFGLDASYTTSELFGDKNFVAMGSIATSMDNGEWDKNQVGYRIMVDYPNDLFDHYIAIASIPTEFNPELGFLGRTNYDALNWKLSWNPRIKNRLGIRKLALQPWNVQVYRTNSTRILESVTAGMRPLGIIFNSGESLEYTVQYNFDRLNEEFELSDFLTLPTGDYQFWQHSVQFETFQGRRLWYEADLGFGQFYNGKMTTLETVVGLNVNKNLNIEAEYELNRLKFDPVVEWVHQSALYLNYAFNTRIGLSLFGQWNNEDDRLLLNFRIHWIPRIGSDFYFVLNNGYEPMHQAELIRPEIHSTAAKLVWRFVF